MYGNPYFGQTNIDKIDNQIRDLERLKQNMTQPLPIQNIINTNNIEFEARFVNDNENPEEIIVQRKTAFISPKNGYLKIKELNGDIEEYILTKPKTKEELYIEELERRLEEYEHRTNNEICEPTTNDIESNESTTKSNSRAISKKS